MWRLYPKKVLTVRLQNSAVKWQQCTPSQISSDVLCASSKCILSTSVWMKMVYSWCACRTDQGRRCREDAAPGDDLWAREPKDVLERARGPDRAQDESREALWPFSFHTTFSR